MNREELTMNRAKILDAAKACVYGEREEDFRLIADLWTEYLGKKIFPEDVAMMMVLLKLARIKTGTCTLDSYIDDNIAFYSFALKIGMERAVERLGNISGYTGKKGR